MRTSKLSNRFLSDFVTLIYVYDRVINDDRVKRKRFADLKTFLDGRAAENRDYFSKNECIKTAYYFVKKVIDYVTMVC